MVGLVQRERAARLGDLIPKQEQVGQEAQVSIGLSNDVHSVV